MTRHHSCRVSPFGHPRIHARLTAPRGITQPPTSFIGSQCQGIHHAPLNTYNTKPKVIQNFENCTSTHTKTPTPKRAGATCVPDARNHYPQIKHHTPPPKQGNNQTHPRKGGITPGSPTTGRRGDGPVVSKPNSVSGNSLTGINPLPAQRLSCTDRTPTTGPGTDLPTANPSHM